MRQRGILVLALAWIFMIFYQPLINFGESRFSESPPALQQNQRILVAAPSSGDNWPINTAQLIQWSTKFLSAGTKLNVELFGEPESVDLTTDDDAPESALIEDGGLIVVNRLTPQRYPATLRRIYIRFDRGQDQPDPVGRQVTLLVFTDPTGSGTPPNNPEFLYEQVVTITRTGAFLNFLIPDGPVLAQGDFYIGYRAPDPANGVGFALDTDGQQQQRAFVSRDGGITFQSLSNRDGTRIEANVLIRARVEQPATETKRLSKDPVAADTGSLCWRVTGPTNMRARIRIFSPDDPTIITVSDPFTISAALQSITVTAPTLNEVWTVGQDRIITWMTQDITGNVKIELSRDGGQTFPEVICANCENNGMRRWRVTGNQPAAAMIKISSLVDPHIFGLSPLFFIAPPGQSDFSWLDELDELEEFAQAPAWSECDCNRTQAFTPELNPPGSLRVDVPNLGEVWRVGETRKIFWSSNQVSGNVRIAFSTDGGFTFQTILDNEPNDGVADWTIPASARGSACRIRVSSLVDPTISDTSDGDFVIDFPGQPSITLLTPNGGDDYPAGSGQRIRWRFNGNVGSQVKFELSLDGGKTFQLILDNVTNNTDRTWTVPLVPETTTRARLRILSQTSRFIADVSNCDFTIRRP